MESKKCSGCKLEKDLASFSKDKSKKDGMRACCKDCSAKSLKLRRIAEPEKFRKRERLYKSLNPDKVKETARRQRLANPDKNKKRKEQWKLANPDKYKRGNELYRLNNAEKIRKSQKKWALNNPDKANKRSREWRLKNLDKDRSRHNKKTEQLSDGYIAFLIRRRTGLSTKDILQYPELIEAKRAQLMILREINKT